MTTAKWIQHITHGGFKDLETVQGLLKLQTQVIKHRLTRPDCPICKERRRTRQREYVHRQVYEANYSMLEARRHA